MTTAKKGHITLQSFDIAKLKLQIFRAIPSGICKGKIFLESLYFEAKPKFETFIEFFIF